MVNIRLNILEREYDAMVARTDADDRTLTRYEHLIENEYRRMGKATGLNARLASFRTRRPALV